MRKRRGPRTDPWGTSAKTGLHDAICAIKTTLCSLPDREFCRML